jgi:hypothetical protein
VETTTSGVNRLKGCIFVGHTNTDMDRCGGLFCDCMRCMLYVCVFFCIVLCDTANHREHPR